MADEKNCGDLTPSALAAIVAEAVRAANPPKASRAPRHNVLGIVSICLVVVGLLGGGIGVWVSMTNKAAVADSRLTTVENRQQNISTRVVSLEEARTSSSNTATEVKDLKENFNGFLVTYHDDQRDLKQTLEQIRGGKR